MTSTKPTVETARAARRNLHFENLDQAIAEAQRLAQLAREGRVQYAGNWDAGQILNHLGVWAEFAYGGNPVQVPFFLRWLGPLILKRFLRTGMRAGYRIPRLPRGTVGMDPTPVDQALARMTGAFTRLKNHEPQVRHPLFGRMSHRQYAELNLRHAELHLSFISERSQPQESSSPGTAS